MNIPTIINVAISLIFIFLILSLLTSEIQEAIATLREWRAKHLKNSIITLLNQEITEKLYTHDLIQSLNQKGKNRASNGPSYIPSDIFASVLIDIFTLYLSDSQGIAILETKINNSALPQNLKNILLTFVKTIETQDCKLDSAVKDLHHQIATWFDESMQRSSGVYKRNAKGMSFLLGLAVAVIANADTVYLVQRLHKEEILRSTVAQVSEEILAKNSDAIVKCLNTAKDQASKDKCLVPLRQNLNTALNDISSLPIGWNLSNPLKQLQEQQSISSVGTWDLRGIIKVIFGWFLSAVAISMGAPFWFEALNKIINVRNAGKKPNSTAE
ncbi:hypothetical protein [Argonema galeatum]|uniref:hypothetical protein n=1 Tax=Argonema galeatum TaxID=2942762 RepID=UPI0020116D40|nr:hypothetical protein [Argonema galeatum]MCL1465679.1 hypothetical protein [Argonema galeatum A003/A1]